MAYIFLTRKPDEGGIGWPDLETRVIANKLLNLLDIVFSSTKPHITYFLDSGEQQILETV